ncbi:MAG: response regulator transcription factor [Alphaproteobacteria bacterium]|nr:response regulator transcription factor [Alphaproteobacteria bacterium]
MSTITPAKGTLSKVERQTTPVMVLAKTMLLRNMLLDMLRRLDFIQVRDARTPQDAIAQIQAIPPRLMLVQHQLSDIDGGPTAVHFTASMRKRFKFPIIVITPEKPPIDLIKDCSDAGVNHLVPLSCSAEDLNRAINQTFMHDMLLMPRLMFMKEQRARGAMP